jgi:hypothetical protein
MICEIFTIRVVNVELKILRKGVKLQATLKEGIRRTQRIVEIFCVDKKNKIFKE